MNNLTFLITIIFGVIIGVIASYLGGPIDILTIIISGLTSIILLFYVYVKNHAKHIWRWMGGNPIEGFKKLEKIKSGRILIFCFIIWFGIVIGFLLHTLLL
jgi:ABC-type dipeptide/oligopeptide/nickel transport system permease subunit